MPRTGTGLTPPKVPQYVANVRLLVVEERNLNVPAPLGPVYVPLASEPTKVPVKMYPPPEAVSAPVAASSVPVRVMRNQLTDTRLKSTSVPVRLTVPEPLAAAGLAS